MKELNILRGISSFLVVINHLRAIYFVDFKSAEHNYLVSIFYFFTGLGRQSVIVFFVLSGYLISKKLFDDKQVNLNIFNFLLNRLIRLWIVLLPALLFTFFFDYLGIKVFNNKLLSGQFDFGGLLSSNVWVNLNFLNFIGNILFFQGFFCKTFGSNFSLWSLSIEFWFYVIFILGFYIFKQKFKNFVFKYLSIMILFIMFLLFFRYNLFKYLVIIFLGFLPSFIRNYKGVFLYNKIIKLRYFVVFNFLVMIFISRFLYDSFIFEFFLGLSCAFYISSIDELENKYFRLYKPVSFFSKISYSLYAVHLSFILFFVGIFNLDINNQFTFLTFFKYLMILSISIMFSYFFYLSFERKTNILRNWLQIVLKF